MKTDTEITQMIRKRGRDQEEAIYLLMQREKTEWYIKPMLRKMSLTSEECEEAMDDTYMALVTAVGKGTFDSRKSIGAYLWGAARRIALKIIDKRPKFQPTENPGPSPGPDVDPRLAKVLRLLEGLAEKCRNILRLAFFEEKTNEEIAEILGYKSKAVVAVKRSECITRLRGLADKNGLL